MDKNKSTPSSFGKIVLNGEVYNFQIIDKVKYVEGLTVIDFIEKLNNEGNRSAILKAAEIGLKKVRGKYKKETYEK